MKRGKVAAGLFINKKNQILLHLRDKKKSIQNPDTWGFIGGHVNENEGIEGALEREIKEEIGIGIKNPVFIEVFDDKVGNDVFVYRINIDKSNGDVKNINLTEGQRIKFFSLEDILKMKKVPSCMKDFFKRNKEKIFN